MRGKRAADAATNRVRMGIEPMTDRPVGLVVRAVNRIQTQRPESAFPPALTIPHPDLLGSSPRRRESRDDAPPKHEASAVRASREERLLPTLRSVTLWGAIAFGCAGLLLGARAFLLPPSAKPSPMTAAQPTLAAPPAAPAAVPMEAARPAPQSDDLVAFGNNFLETGDIATARLYFERAAETGNARAALLLGETYDPVFLTKHGVRGMRGDAEAAARWYQRARDLGDADAPRRLPESSDKQ
jgi:hypothetical protein